MMGAGASGQAAVELDGVGMVYPLFRSRGENAANFLSSRLGRRLFGIPPQHTALEGIDLRVHRGDRIGIVGRNGAGKSSLLKIITGILAPTSGTCRVQGTVQALMRTGGMFHPAFTGRENIRASISVLDLSDEERRDAEADIISFCELGDYIDQPFRTYSLGMQSRLEFACATVIRPDVVLIDEVLGAGDGYFAGKSARRMQDLADTGCAMIVVSHSMGQILQYCTEVVWIENGRIIERGPARPMVIKYEKFLAELRQAAGIQQVEQLEASSSDLLRRNAARALAVTQDAKVVDGSVSQETATAANRWGHNLDTGEPPFEIAAARWLGPDGLPCSVIKPNDSLLLRTDIRRIAPGPTYCLTIVSLYSERAELLSRHVSPRWELDMVAVGEMRTIDLMFDRMQLGSGTYFISISIHDNIELRNMAVEKRYDLYGRMCAFVVLEDPVDDAPRFRLPARWLPPRRAADVADGVGQT